MWNFHYEKYTVIEYKIFWTQWQVPSHQINKQAFQTFAWQGKLFWRTTEELDVIVSIIDLQLFELLSGQI